MLKRIANSLFTLSLLVLLTNCNNNATSDKTNVIDSLSGKPVETKEPNTKYVSAFAGQTRIGSVKTKATFTEEKLTEGLGRPWAIISFPGDRLLMTEKSGYMNLLDANGKILSKIEGFPKVDDRGQGGLLDVALDPDFSTNRTLYWSYAEKKDTTNQLAIAKGQLSADEKSIQNVSVIFRAGPDMNSEYHYGSRLVFDKDGSLFVSSGERGILEGRVKAQDMKAGMGKIFRITKDGKPATGNPFIGNKDAMPEIYSLGHRNPQGIALHPETGDLWEVEFGPRGGDELNLIKSGKNYGWPIITYGIEYSGEAIGDSIQQKEGMEQPVYYWDPVISPSGIIFYSGAGIEEWKNNLFICGLSSTHLARIVIENNKVVGEERLMESKKERLRDVTELNGALYIVSDTGILFRIKKS